MDGIINNIMLLYGISKEEAENIPVRDILRVEREIEIAHERYYNGVGRDHHIHLDFEEDIKVNVDTGSGEVIDGEWNEVKEPLMIEGKDSE